MCCVHILTGQLIFLQVEGVTKRLAFGPIDSSTVSAALAKVHQGKKSEPATHNPAVTSILSALGGSQTSSNHEQVREQ